MELGLNSILADLGSVGAGTTLVIAGCLIFFAGIFFPVDRSATEENRTWWWAVLSLVALAIAAIYGLLGPPPQGAEAYGLFRVDGIARAALYLAILGGIVTILAGFRGSPLRWNSEYHGCLLLMMAGLVFVGASNDLITLVLSMELVSLPTTVILAMTRKGNLGSEATLKYFALSALSSSIFMLGISYLYGIAGSTQIPQVLMAFSQSPSILTKLSFGLILGGVCFRIAAVPFHFYASDVFAGASSLAASLLAVVPKVAGFLVLARFLSGATLNEQWGNVLIPILMVLAVITMTIGNLLALHQKNLRRLFAYSSIAHSGYLLLAVAAVVAHASESSVVFRYLTAYLAMTLGAFAVLIAIFEQDQTISRGDLKGLAFRRPILTGCMVVCLLSLTGIPLTAGFWVKFQVIFTALSASNSVLRWGAIWMGLNSAIAAVYYLDLLIRMFQRAELSDKHVRPLLSPSAAFASTLCAIATIVWFIAPRWL